MNASIDAVAQPPGFLANVKVWVMGARLKTMPAVFAPVGIGTALAYSYGDISISRIVLTLLFALGFTIGTNYLNDYSDGIRGTDAHRVGPTRIVGSGQAAPKQVLYVGLALYAVSIVAGLILSATVSPWMLILTVICPLGGWFYTGGENPYGYKAMGEVGCFVFFGVVAVCGTVFIQTGEIPWLALGASFPPGLLVCALLVTNNLRDIETDAMAGKTTLAVLLGKSKTRALYVAFIVAIFASGLALVPFRPWALLVLGALPFAVFPMRRVLSGAKGRDLIPALEHTCLLMFVYGALLTAALAQRPVP